MPYSLHRSLASDVRPPQRRMTQRGEAGPAFAAGPGEDRHPRMRALARIVRLAPFPSRARLMRAGICAIAAESSPPGFGETPLPISGCSVFFTNTAKLLDYALQTNLNERHLDGRVERDVPLAHERDGRRAARARRCRALERRDVVVVRRRVGARRRRRRRASSAKKPEPFSKNDRPSADGEGGGGEGPSSASTDDGRAAATRGATCAVISTPEGMARAGAKSAPRAMATRPSGAAPRRRTKTRFDASSLPSSPSAGVRSVLREARRGNISHRVSVEETRAASTAKSVLRSRFRRRTRKHAPAAAPGSPRLASPGNRTRRRTPPSRRDRRTRRDGDGAGAAYASNANPRPVTSGWRALGASRRLSRRSPRDRPGASRSAARDARRRARERTKPASVAVLVREEIARRPKRARRVPSAAAAPAATRTPATRTSAPPSRAPRRPGASSARRPSRRPRRLSDASGSGSGASEVGVRGAKGPGTRRKKPRTVCFGFFPGFLPARAPATRTRRRSHQRGRRLPRMAAGATAPNAHATQLGSRGVSQAPDTAPRARAPPRRPRRRNAWPVADGTSRRASRARRALRFDFVFVFETREADLGDRRAQPHVRLLVS